ncbi:hypothetical protein [Mycobacterium sp.]|uniref:hypothetical protein n=1 Tax=Mycobacterium sp. TaxID=1785 RepID=UPI002BF9C9A9|nr:hypothetical protein [Mycobacterium sp.]HKP39689.1 hypothetical protein [Mycobacterium sp.]
MGNRTGTMAVLGLAIGTHLLATFIVIGFLAPALPLLLAGAASISPRTRPFAMGSLAATLGGVVFLITYAISQSF